MRIIAGSHKGRRFEAPRGGLTRPTSDFVREAAFTLIGPLEGAQALDLYAGSGGFGLEALSRGAQRCVFVDSSPAACAAIEANLARLGLTGSVVRAEAVAALRRERGPFDLVFCDPPYAEEVAASLAPSLVGVLAPGGILVYQTPAGVEPDLPGLTTITSRRYGSARLTLSEL